MAGARRSYRHVQQVQEDAGHDADAVEDGDDAMTMAAAFGAGLSLSSSTMP